MVHPTRTQQQLAPLRESIVDKPPYISGTLKLPESCFSLFYKLSNDDAARHINIANATLEKLEQLAQACEPACFGLNQECVLDETYRKAGDMEPEGFSSTLDLSHTDLMNIIRNCLLEGTQSTKTLKTELYKLNVYVKGSFSKPHVDTPRSGKMFGSLVVVFPSPHEGGSLLLRHRGQEWSFDSGKALAAAKDQSSIGYVAFFSDIEHEVTPVTSGHRITLTYNLYFDDGGPVSPNDAVSEHLISPSLPNQDSFRDAFAALLGDPEFLADGGTLGFGLRHVYPIQKDLEHVYKILKGSDAVVYQSVRALGYEPVLYLYYSEKGVMIDKVLDFSRCAAYFSSHVVGPGIQLLAYGEGGVAVPPQGEEMTDDPFVKAKESIEWLTPVTEFNRQTDAVALGYAGNEPGVDWGYGDVCLVVRIGEAHNRLAYRTVAQLEAEYRASNRHFQMNMLYHQINSFSRMM